MGLVRQQFEKAGTMERSQLLVPRKKQKTNVYPLVLPYNPKLPLVSKIIRKNIDILHSNSDYKELFPVDSLFPAFKRGKNLKEIFSPSRFSSNKPQKANLGCQIICSKRCDLCGFLVSTPSIRSIKTKEIFTINHNLNCKSKYVIYVLTDNICQKQLVGSAVDMKARLSNYKSHIKQHYINQNNKGCSAVTHWWATEAHQSVHPLPESLKDYHEALRNEMSFTLVDQLAPIRGEGKAQSITRLRALEGEWENRLQTLHPYGLNIRDENRHHQ